MAVFPLRRDAETDRHRGKNTGSQGGDSHVTGVTYLKSERCQKSWPKQDAEARKESPPELLESTGLLTPGLALSESGMEDTLLLFECIPTWRTHTAAVCLEATHFGSLLQQV